MEDSETAPASRLVVQPDVSPQTAFRISGQAETFLITLYNSVGEQIAQQSIVRGGSATFTTLAHGFYLVRTQGYRAGDDPIGYFDQSVDLSRDTSISVPALLYSPAPAATIPMKARGAIGFIAFSDLPDQVTGGTDFDIMITAFDIDGSVYKEASGQVVLTSTGIDGDFGTMSYVAGQAEFRDLRFPLVTNGKAVFTATGSSLSASTPDIPVSQGELLEPATELVDTFLTVFVSVLPPTPGDEDSAYFFSYDHKWDLESNTGEGMSIVDGEDDSFDEANSLRLGISGGSLTDFAAEQLHYDDLTWLTPLFGQGDGLVAAAVVPPTSDFGDTANSSHRAYLAPGKENRLQQRVDLTTATGALTLRWRSNYQVPQNQDFSVPDQEYRVVLRSTSGGLLETLDTVRNGQATGGGGAQVTTDISDYTGQIVVLSFELLNAQRSDYAGEFDITFVDDVSISDGSSTEFVVNGDFETGDLTGWTQFVRPLSQHVKSDPRTIAGVEVVRYVYADPSENWARWFDQFKNTTGSPITLDIQLEFDIGHDHTANRYDGTGGTGLVISSSDSGGDDDLAGVYGNAAGSTPFDVNATSIISYTVTVPAGETRSIVSFLLQSNQSSNGSEPTALLRKAEDISNDLLSDPQLLRGLTQAQYDSIANF